MELLIGASFLTVFNRCVLTAIQINMEGEERAQQERKHQGQHPAYYDKVGRFVIEKFRTGHALLQDRQTTPGDNVARHSCVKQHAQEKLVVVESNAIGNPRAVMVHLEDTPIALRAVMTAVGLGLEAPLADAHAALLLLLHRDYGCFWCAGFGRRSFTIVPLYQRTLASCQVLVVFVRNLSGVLRKTLNNWVRKAILTNSTRITHERLAFFSFALSGCLHVPFAVFRDVTGISHNDAYHRDQEPEGKPGESDAAANCFLSVLVEHVRVLPDRLEGNVGEVHLDGGIEVELVRIGYSGVSLTHE